MHLNILKAQQIGFVTDLKTGDKVRIDEWMLKESEECDYVIVNNFKVFVGLPVICKSTMTLKRTNKIKELSVEWTQELKIRHYLKRELKAVREMRYTWYNQPLENQ
jgi:hypothetical protein